MFKKKKTYIDKINFDVFEDEPSDFDLFSKDSYDEEDEDIDPDESEKDGEKDSEKEIDEDIEEETDEDTSKDKIEEDVIKEDKLEEDKLEEDEIDDDIEIDDEDMEDVAPEDISDDDTSFSYDDFDKIGSEDDIPDKKDKEKVIEKKKKNTGKVVALVCLWLLIFGAGVAAFLYFQTDVFKKKKKDNTTTETTATTEIQEKEETEDTSEPIDENFYTIYSYETNADVNINALMADYYDALVKGDSEKLKDIVTEPDAFGDMMIYETKAQVISEYSNITCYTIPGLNDNEILVFTTSNVTITGVTSKPLDIKQFYVVKDGNNYKINNGVLSQEVIDYINVQAGSPDVQALYKSVQDNINQCLAEDSTFADFYNKINADIEDKEE
ncbi:MAG: hypothetical protein IJ054_03710 [Lachnospiraceae bacterium]|nr:hypothetical protein [Lachnospiraceae bacterium]MBQ9234633.1 hypothetical protein [Lachnospiraceae bacterium]